MAWRHKPTSPFSQASAAATWRANGCSDGNASATSKSTSTASACYASESQTGCSTTRRSRTTLKHSTGDRGVDAWIASLEAHHVSHSALRGNERENLTSGISGPPPSSAFAKYNRAAGCLKTYPALYPADILPPYSGPWPTVGMMRNGVYCLRRTLALPISESDFGFTLPTPTACDHKGSGRPRKNRGPKNNLRDWFRQNYGFLYPPVPVVEWLIGIPIGWTALEPLAMDRFRSWLQLHGGC